MADSLTISGEIDIATAPTLSRQLGAAIDAHPGEVVVVDFARVTFIDSSGLGSLVAAQRRAQSAGGDVTITNLKPNLRTVFELTGLDKVLLAPAEVA